MVMNPRDWEPGGPFRPYSIFSPLFEPCPLDPFTHDHSLDAAPYSIFAGMTNSEPCVFEDTEIVIDPKAPPEAGD